MLLSFMLTTGVTPIWAQSKEPFPVNELSFLQTEDFVSDLHDLWSFSSLSYFRATDYGKYGARLNYRNRFSENGAQYQLETYPKLGQKIYTMFILSYADKTQIHFPTFQIRIEPYFNLIKAFEISLGWETRHYKQFNSQNIDTLTLSLGKYSGNYYVWLRPFHFKPTESTFFEMGLRRYFKDQYTYLTLRSLVGKLPDIADLPPLDQIIDSRQIGLSLEGQYPIMQALFLKGGVGYYRQEFFPSKNQRTTISGNIGVLCHF